MGGNSGGKEGRWVAPAVGKEAVKVTEGKKGKKKKREKGGGYVKVKLPYRWKHE